MKEKRSIYGTGTVLAGFLLLFIALGSLVLGIVLTARRTNALLFRHELERTANGLVEDFARNNRLEEAFIEERITGFGILRWNGGAIVSYGEEIGAGEVPAEMDRGPVFVYDSKKAAVTLYRPIGLARVPGHGPRMQPRASGLDLGWLLYLRFSAAGHFREQRLYTLAAVVGPVLVGVLTGLLFYLFVRNLHFRRKIAEKEKLAQLGESARTLMHEIKNPLNAINIRATILADSSLSEVAEDARAIREEVGRLRNLADKIGTFLRDPTGEREEIALLPLVREILQANRWTGIKLLVDTREGEPEVGIYFDRQRFRSVLENVIANAYETGAKTTGGEAGIELVVEIRKRRVTVKVLDRGDGLPPMKKERLFDPFFTTKTDGSGIGLAVSRRFMQAAGGSIELRPREGGGTEALLCFQRVER